MKVKQQELVIDVISIKRAALLLRALNHPFRQKILHLIHYNKALCVMQLQEQLCELQPVVSMHLSLLRDTGLVEVRREGKMRWYSVNYERLDTTFSSASELWPRKQLS